MRWVKTSSVSCPTSEENWFCGSRSLALNHMQTFIWAPCPLCNFSFRVCLFKQVAYVSKTYWGLNTRIPKEVCPSGLTWGETVGVEMQIHTLNSPSYCGSETVVCRNEGWFEKKEVFRQHNISPVTACCLAHCDWLLPWLAFVDLPFLSVYRLVCVAWFSAVSACLPLCFSDCVLGLWVSSTGLHRMSHNIPTTILVL